MFSQYINVFIEYFIFLNQHLLASIGKYQKNFPNCINKYVPEQKLIMSENNTRKLPLK